MKIEFNLVFYFIFLNFIVLKIFNCMNIHRKNKVNIFTKYSFLNYSYNRLISQL